MKCEICEIGCQIEEGNRFYTTFFDKPLDEKKANRSFYRFPSKNGAIFISGFPHAPD